MGVHLQDRQVRISPEMQGTLSSIRKLTGPRRPTYKSYYIS